MIKKTRLLIFVVAALLPQVVWAASPLQTVETHVNQLVSILNAKSQTAPDDADKKKEAIRSVSDSLFDFFELSRLTLGRDWKSLNAEQQKEFVILYRKLLESIYMDRLLQYKDEKVIFKKETTLSKNRSEVQTDIVSVTGNIPINYRMVLKGDQWKVYDLIIENVSLARNYRGQFNSILSDGNPEKLLSTLRKKIEDI